MVAQFASFSLKRAQGAQVLQHNQQTSHKAVARHDWNPLHAHGAMCSNNVDEVDFPDKTTLELFKALQIFPQDGTDDFVQLVTVNLREFAPTEGFGNQRLTCYRTRAHE